MWRKGNPYALLGFLVGAATVGNTMEVLQKIERRSAILPSKPNFGYLSEEIQD